MRLHFLGANRQVTGSRYCLEWDGRQVMIDCGLFQEREYVARNWNRCPIPAKNVRALLLTHIHIDHSGLIPKLVAEGFRGPIFCTRPTAALARIMLLDSARIQMEDVQYKRKRHRREGRRGAHPEVPLYTDTDVEDALRLFEPVAYDDPLEVDRGMRVTFFDAGHILGSALLRIDVEHRGGVGTGDANGPAGDGAGMRRFLFSGDLGQWDKPLIRDPTLVDGADYVVLESTYGDRMHETERPVDEQLAEVVAQTVARGGKVVVPVFAVERAQELVYLISGLAHDRKIPELPVFLDSPMAADVTEIFRRFSECLDEETLARIEADRSPFHYSGLRFARTVEESKQVNAFDEPCVILSTSGMCTEGRIKHHLRRTIEDSRNTILFVGFQGRGTLGRRIVDREPEVRIHGRAFRVRADVRQISGFSAHADQGGLLRWLGAFRRPPHRVFLTHGEESASKGLADVIRERFGWPTSIPTYQEVFPLQ
ncbi:MAG: MBL fold metallo-hydrolase [Planctomycetes bacterium]|nr:MBL fold metallo-hydrolase [Planctomycetota bacterium]